MEAGLIGCTDESGGEYSKRAVEVLQVTLFVSVIGWVGGVVVVVVVLVVVLVVVVVYFVWELLLHISKRYQESQAVALGWTAFQTKD